MKTAKMIFPKLNLQNRRAQKEDTQAENYIFTKFNKVGFLVSLVLGIISSGIGVYLIGSANTIPYSVSNFISPKRLSGFIPESSKDMLVFLLGNIFVLIGVICIFLALKYLVRFISGKMKD